jgi:hypothetical protein
MISGGKLLAIVSFILRTAAEITDGSSGTAAAATTSTISPAVRAFLTHATQKIMAHDATAHASPSPLELVAARNEYEPLLVVLQSSPVAVDSATATVPGTIVEFRAARVGYVAVVNVTDCDSSGPGLYPDPLIPDVDSFVSQKRNAFPVTVPAGQNRLLLIDLFVPPGARPGTHPGHVTLTAGTGKTVLPFTLTIFEHTLPSTASMQSTYGIEPQLIFTGHHLIPHDGAVPPAEVPAAQELYKRYLDAGLMHRISGGSTMSTAEGFGDFEEHYDSYV